MRNFYYIFFFLLLVGKINSYAQIFSSKADFVEKTDYETLDREDSIFVFNLTETDATLNIGSLELYSPDSVSKYDFTWYLFDDNSLTFNFQQVVKAENDTNYSSIEYLGEGGYSVISTNGVQTDTAYAWVFVNDFALRNFGILGKNPEGVLPPKACEYVEFSTDVELDTFYYFDEVSKSQHIISTTYDIDISSDPMPDEWESLPSKRSSVPDELRMRSSRPPTEDTYYFLEITDKYGVKKFDTVFYETIHTKAIIDTIPQWLYFDFEIDDKPAEYYDDNTKMSAPFSSLFTPIDSENASRFVWNFGDGSADTTYYEPDSIKYTFYHIDPLNSLNPYTIVLTTYSEAGCASADSIEITLEESELTYPPFFTPNDDGQNDRWRVYDVSIREFELWIFNRWGRVVHKFNGDDIRDWQGWDGKFKDTNQDAPEGVYYFIYRARGWGKEPDNENKTATYEENGFFHLYRSEKW